MIFLTIFSFYLLRGVKDALLQSAPGSGAEIFSFLKLYLVLPATMLLMTFYIMLRKYCSLESAYYIVLSIFVLFFTIFAVYLYPNHHLLHPSAAQIQILKQAYPAFKWFITIYGYWVFALFYVVSELWGALMLSVLFWQLANDNVSTAQAQRFYPLFITFGNIAMLCLNPVMHYLAQDSYNDMIQVCWIIAGAGLSIMACLRYAYSHGLLKRDQPLGSSHADAPKRSLYESIALVMRSPYIGYISIMVLSYGLLINVVEAMWKSQTGLLYDSRADLMRFNADYTFWTGVATITMNYLSKSMISKVGWTTSALITPVVCACFGMLFFFFVLHTDYVMAIFSLQQSPLLWTVWLGAFAVMISKGAKYSFFDPTKEMAFIPLDKEMRSNGKVVADGVVERFGKSLGGATISSLIMYTGYDLTELGYFLGSVTLLLGLLWLYAVLRLGELYKYQLDVASCH